MARKRTYRTNKGKPIDMEAMRTANEKTLAAGNMSVNAKGDIVQGGKVVKTAKERTAVRYESTKQVKQTSLKKPLTQQDTKTTTPAKPKPVPIEEAEITTETVKNRDDGSKYKEVMTPDGDIEIKEIDPPKTKKKASKKKASKKKKPTV